MSMPSHTRPNFLLITTDQQRFDTIGAAGNGSIWTPHLDWLCDTGIRFSRAYSDCPICAPARATIMTGLHAHTHGQLANGGLSPMSRFPTLPGLLTQAGYQTRAEGKMHFSPLRAHYGFEHMRLLPDYYREMSRLGGPQPKEHGVGENEVVPVFTTTDETRTVTHWTVEKSIEFLETRDEDRPFFLWTSFSKPHPPFDAPLSYWHLYDGMELPEPLYGDWSQNVDKIPRGWLGPTRRLNHVDRLSPQQVMAMRRAYYACISHIDYNLGLLFARLREMGLLENTWIVFSSDHGDMQGDHHLGAKSVFLEGSSHVPFIVRPPSQGLKSDERAGTVDERLVCLADILPTFLSRCEVDLPETDGFDLMSSARRERLIGQCGDFHGVIEEQWKYHFSAAGGHELLFDVRNDRYEQQNLIESTPAQAERLRAILAASLKERKHEAFAGGQLIATSQTPDESKQSAEAWPGFHHRSDATCDLLH